MIDSPHWPQVHITEIAEIDGKLVESSITSSVCDFCVDQNPSWDYDCAEFEIEDINFGSLNGWAACNACSEMIEADDYDHLLKRSLDNPLGQAHLEFWESRIRLIHAGFREHRFGERRAWG